MNEPRYIPKYAETVWQAWSGVNRMFPPQWQFQQKEGYIETDAAHFHVATHPPRNAHSALQKLSNFVLGHEAESYIYAWRRETRGVLPLDSRYISRQSGVPDELRTMPPILSIIDERFIPPTAITGQRGSTRLMLLKYLVGAGSDQVRGNYEYGLQFTFLDAPDDLYANWPQMRADYYHPSSGTEFRSYVDAYLRVNGFTPPLHPTGAIETNVEILRKSVQNAVAASMLPADM